MSASVGFEGRRRRRTVGHPRADARKLTDGIGRSWADGSSQREGCLPS